MKKLTAAAIVGIAVAIAGCGGTSGPTIAQQCHAYAIQQEQQTPLIGTVQIFERICVEHPKLLKAK